MQCECGTAELQAELGNLKRERDEARAEIAALITDTDTTAPRLREVLREKDTRIAELEAARGRLADALVDTQIALSAVLPIANLVAVARPMGDGFVNIRRPGINICDDARNKVQKVMSDNKDFKPALTADDRRGGELWRAMEDEHKAADAFIACMTAEEKQLKAKDFAAAAMENERHEALYLRWRAAAKAVEELR